MTDTDREKCNCYYVSEHDGRDADDYVRDHLEEVRVDSENWTIEYRCPRYGKRWLLDQPWGEMHGGGPHRLRTFDKVRRDLRHALATVSKLLPDDADAQSAAATLLEKTENTESFRRP